MGNSAENERMGRGNCCGISPLSPQTTIHACAWCSQGGLLLLEPQPWKSYTRNRGVSKVRWGASLSLCRTAYIIPLLA